MSRTAVKIALASAGCVGTLVLGPGAGSAWAAPTARPSATHKPTRSPSKSPSASPTPSRSPSASPSLSRAVTPTPSTLPVAEGSSSGTIGMLTVGGISAVGLSIAMRRAARRPA